MKHEAEDETLPPEEQFPDENAGAGSSQGEPQPNLPANPVSPPAPDPDSRVAVDETSTSNETKAIPQQADASQNPKMPYAQNPGYRPEMSQLKRCRTLTMAASIAGPVSLFIGGTMLDIAGIICGVLAYRNLKKLLSQSPTQIVYATSLKRTALVAVIFCGIAMALNISAAISIMPELMQMVESGELSSTLPAPSTNAPSSTWG